MIEKRINQRFGPLVIRATFTQGGTERDGFLTNVSVSGAFLAVEAPPPQASELDLSAILPWRLGELRASARVVWRCEGGTEDGRPKLAGVGLLFTRIDSTSNRRLHAYLDRFRELAEQIENEEDDEEEQTGDSAARP